MLTLSLSGANASLHDYSEMPTSHDNNIIYIYIYIYYIYIYIYIYIYMCMFVCVCI